MVIAVSVVAVALSPPISLAEPAAGMDTAGISDKVATSLKAINNVAAGNAPIAISLVILGIVGASHDDQSEGLFTWDCWKPVVHDESPQPSQGMPLEELLSHPACDSFTFDEQGGRVLIDNVYGERFELTSVHVPGHGLAWHATMLARSTA
jgi:hypothetical protein